MRLALGIQQAIHSKVKAQALTSQPTMLASSGRDLEAEAVANVPPSPDEVEQPEAIQDEEYAPTTPASDNQRDMREIDEMLMSVPGKSKSALDLLQPIAQPIEMMGGNEPMEEEDPHGTKHAAESVAGEPEAKAMRLMMILLQNPNQRQLELRCVWLTALRSPTVMNLASRSLWMRSPMTWTLIGKQS